MPELGLTVQNSALLSEELFAAVFLCFFLLWRERRCAITYYYGLKLGPYVIC